MIQRRHGVSNINRQSVKIIGLAKTNNQPTLYRVGFAIAEEAHIILRKITAMSLVNFMMMFVVVGGSNYYYFVSGRVTLVNLCEVLLHVFCVLKLNFCA